MATTDRVLLTPIQLGPVEIRNRVVSTSHQTSLVEDHIPTDALVAYHAARARGGAGLISLEATAVHGSGLLTPHIIGGYLPQIVPAYRRLTSRVHEHGTRLFVQLLHGGREQISSAPRASAIAPSAIPSQRFLSEPRAMTKTEIEEIVAGFAASARHCLEGGVDGIEISMAHGYLLSQFFSPMSNQREDEYNGDLDNRLRFAREVLSAVREAAGPGLAIGVRLAADEWAPGSLREDECRQIAVALCAEGGVDFVSLALGHSATYSGSNLIAPPPPVGRNAIADRARRIRAALSGIPVIATTRVLDVDSAESLIADGAADLVGMTRAMIADPELVAKTAAGRGDEVIPCVGCNQGCIGHYHAGLPIACLVNPRTGRETDPVIAPKSAIRGRVLVVGAGPAGIAAALAAAEAGRQVVLAERTGAIGGQFRIAGRAPGHREMWTRYEDFFSNRLRATGVDLRLGTEITAADAGGFAAVVVATGAQPYLPPRSEDLPGHVAQAWDAISDPGAIEGPVLVAWWGGGWSGLDAAETLAEAGLEVTLACAAAAVGKDVHQYQRNLYLDRLDRLGVRLEHHTELVVEDSQPLLRNPFSNRTRPLPGFATIILDQGRVPDDRLWADLSGAGNCIRVGDVLGPRSAEEAILEGSAWFEALAASPR